VFIHWVWFAVAWEASSSQEVVWSSSVDVAEFVLLGSWVELQESVLHKFVNFHDGRLVTASVAVVWSRKHCDDVSVVRPVVTVHYQLVGSSDQLEVVGVVELFTNVLAKRIACTSWRNTPSTSVVWVRPEKITDWAFVGNFHDTIKLLDLVKSVDTWRKTTMQAEDV
jgi:hypothetical protein